jgi:hypothetical protein
MPQTYQKPDLPAHATVNAVVPKDLKAPELGPKTMVTCINRGSDPYLDKCDGRDYVVPPGLFEVEYEVADHFRLRSVVPGSRDPVSGAQDTFIAILGLDPPEKCVPFNQADQQHYKTSVEAIDRDVIEQEQGGKAVVVATSRARARSVGQGHRRPETQVQQNESQEAAPDAASPAVGGDAARAGRGEDV